jgi:hypothetical protein
VLNYCRAESVGRCRIAGIIPMAFGLIMDEPRVLPEDVPFILMCSSDIVNTILEELQARY